MQLSSISLAITRLGQLQWTPAQLFSSGEQGVWYDPSDFSTMFQDSAGTTPVTAVEQPVGKILDKSGRGNHATQATSASRPVLSARVNLLTYSEEFSNAAWSKANVTIVANAATAPDGTVTADHLYPTTSGLDRSTYQAVGGYKIMSVYAKAAGLSFLWFISTPSVVPCIWFNLSTGAVGTTISGYTGTMESVGDGWYRCTVVAASGTFTYNQIGVSSADNSRTATTSGTDGIYIWGAQIETGSTATRYQSITTATSYDTVGFPHYLKFDGVDDSLSTGTVDFTSTDKMTVFAGVRKLSDAATGVPFEFSAGVNSNNGSFGSSVNGAGLTEKYSFGTRGTVAIYAATTSAVYNSPNSSVYAGIGDISGDISRLRLNGATIATTTTDQGTGNYGNYPLYIGRRGGSSLPFNGHLYSLIVRGAQSSDSQIVSAESYVNSKTGAY